MPRTRVVDLFNAPPGTIVGQARIARDFRIKGELTDSMSRFPFHGTYSSSELSLWGFGPQDTEVVLASSGTTTVRVRSLPPSPVPDRQVTASVFRNNIYTAYCVDASTSGDTGPTNSVSCVFSTHREVSGHLVGELDGEGVAELTGQICLAEKGCVPYAKNLTGKLNASSVEIPLPEAAGRVSYNLNVSVPVGEGAPASEFRLYHAANSLALPSELSCTVWRGGAGNGENNSGGINPPPQVGGVGMLPPPGMGGL
jgi:hypothetical protein